MAYTILYMATGAAPPQAGAKLAPAGYLWRTSKKARSGTAGIYIYIYMYTHILCISLSLSIYIYIYVYTHICIV